MPPEPAHGQQTMAAVDLGSNSFHMIVARFHDGHMQVIDRLKEMVRLGEGLTAEGDLTPEVSERALACLTRFGQRLRDMPAANVRAVGTNTLRQLHPQSRFLARAEEALGHPIDVIAGREEARLIYLGVAYGLPGDERRLVVDIGGGSTELIVGEGFTPRIRESLYMGCVSLSRKFFADGKITAKLMDKAELASALEVRPVRELFRQAGWQRAVGSSGTIKSIAAVVAANGWCAEGISAESLARLREAMIERGRVNNLDLPGLPEERRAVLPGGVAVLRGIFTHLGIPAMQVSDLALREGLLYEMTGRVHEDVRERTVRTLSRRFGVDRGHAERVRETALMLYRELAQTWQLDHPSCRLTLGWAARLHEIGLMIAHNQYHKHGAYVLANADLGGFSRQEQAVLAVLVQGHRRRFPSQAIAGLPAAVQTTVRRLTVILRLSVLLHRGRSPTSKPLPVIIADLAGLRLRFPEDWLAAHPLTQAELEQESERLAAVGIRLELG